MTIEIRGLTELQAKLDTLPPRIARGILGSALKAGAVVFQSEMKSRAARATGFLEQHIGIKLAIRKNLSGYALIGPLKADYPRRVPKRGGKGLTISAAAVGRFLEFGTRHMQAKPFIRQSFESRKTAALEAFITKAREAFARAAHG